jgi:hypothetical protein
MKVKGTAFLARKSMLEAELGTERVEGILKEFTASKPSFPKVVLATSTIPIDEFLELNDRIVRDVYDGDEDSYWRFGEASASWALIDGPYRRLREQKSFDEFVGSAALIYKNYFTEGRAYATKQDDGSVELVIDGIPAEHRHVYFEYAIVGYFARGLGLVTDREVSHERLEGFSAGDDRVRYHLTLK